VMEEQVDSHVIWGRVETSDPSPSSSARSHSRDQRPRKPNRGIGSDHLTFYSSGTSSADKSDKTADVVNEFGRTKVASSLRPAKGHKSRGRKDKEEENKEGNTQQEGLPSIGSEHHEIGQCKPCAWVWKPNGCVNGRNCQFCHTCAPGELQIRKKERIAKLKATKKAEKPTIIAL